MILTINIDDSVDEFNYDQYVNERNNITFLTRKEMIEYNVNNQPNKVCNLNNTPNVNNINNMNDIDNMYSATAINMNHIDDTHSFYKIHAKKIKKYMCNIVKNNR